MACQKLQPPPWKDRCQRDETRRRHGVDTYLASATAAAAFFGGRTLRKSMCTSCGAIWPAMYVCGYGQENVRSNSSQPSFFRLETLSNFVTTVREMSSYSIRFDSLPPAAAATDDQRKRPIFSNSTTVHPISLRAPLYVSYLSITIKGTTAPSIRPTFRCSARSSTNETRGRPNHKNATIVVY